MVVVLVPSSEKSQRSAFGAEENQFVMQRLCRNLSACLGHAVLLAAILGGISASGKAPTIVPQVARESQGGYELRWSDEFDKPGPPSSDNWVFESGFIRNEEAQWYQPQNASCERGSLVIEARRERVKVDAAAGTRHIPKWAVDRTHTEYTSASLSTRGKHEWLYGRFVMRAKIPAVEGAWPAFWTLGRGKWPAGGEIDVMEYYDDSLLANVAWLGKNGSVDWKAVKTPIARFGGQSWREAFHDFRMDWDEDSIELYVDDHLLNSTDTTQIKNADEASENPFKKPQFLLVNLAIGGQHGGDPSRTVFPIRYEIDYVRVYQRPNASAAFSDSDASRSDSD